MTACLRATRRKTNLLGDYNTKRMHFMIGYDEKRKTYFVQVKYVDAITGKQHTKKKRGFKLKREAVQYEAGFKLNINNEQQSIGATVTFREIVSLWEDTIESSQESRRQHKDHFEKRFSEYIDKPIKKITRAQLIEWRRELGKTQYSTKTKNMTLSYVRSAFKFASEIYGIKNPSAVLRNFKATSEEKMSEMQVWTIEEFNRFLQCVDNEIYKIYFQTLFWTGARRGEIIALQCDDLIEDKKEIFIHASQRTSAKGRTPTKTGLNRNVKVDDDLYEKLLSLKRTYVNGYLFGGETSLSPTMIDTYFKKAIKESCVKPIRLHDLRHSHATILINEGVNIVAVSKRLGHTDINQTLKTYTHLLKNTDEQMMETINSIVSKKNN